MNSSFFADDGIGLNLNKLREKNPSYKHADDVEVSELVFGSGVTTSDNLSHISGRGVGLDAVRAFVRKENGEIRIEFCNDIDSFGYRMFKFVLFLPYKIPQVLIESEMRAA